MNIISGAVDTAKGMWDVVRHPETRGEKAFRLAVIVTLALSIYSLCRSNAKIGAYPAPPIPARLDFGETDGQGMAVFGGTFVDPTQEETSWAVVIKDTSSRNGKTLMNIGYGDVAILCGDDTKIYPPGSGYTSLGGPQMLAEYLAGTRDLINLRTGKSPDVVIEYPIEEVCALGSIPSPNFNDDPGSPDITILNY